jgi:hypothetical protein
LRWLSENSYFYSFAMNTVWEAAKRARLGSALAARETEFTAPTSINEYRVNLTLALLHRLYEFCKSQGVMLIVLDIPARSELEFLPSVPAELQNTFRENSDALILSEEIFAPYIGLTQLHALSGTGHPNAFSDLMLGMALGEKIRTKLGVP